MKNIGIQPFTPITIIASMLLSGSWYIRQFVAGAVVFHLYYVLFVVALTILTVFLYQALKFGTSKTISNCGAAFFSIFYLGFLTIFVLGLRIDFGPWGLLMFIFTVKSSDIGAYTAGKLFGKHKLVPKISPGKTWEGLAGAIIIASIVALVFSVSSGIMIWWQGVIFGGLFAVLGQLADLAESMIKRDVQQKDSSTSVPGFGGLLDVIDSPLGTAPLAYMFFMLCCN